MTRSEILISSARNLIGSLEQSQPLLGSFIKKLTDEYEQAIVDTIRLEKTIHDLTK